MPPQTAEKPKKSRATGKRRNGAQNGAQRATGPLKLDLGCGQNKQEGFTGVDIVDMEGVDVVCDLFKFPWPFEDSSVDEVFASHWIEHVPDLVATMNELHRIMKPNAQVRFVHPYLKSDRAFQDPTHKQFLSEAAWPYYAKDWRELNRLDHYGITADFGIVNIAAIWQPPWDQKNTETQQFALRHYWNCVSDLIVDLVCRKG